MKIAIVNTATQGVEFIGEAYDLSHGQLPYPYCCDHERMAGRVAVEVPENLYSAGYLAASLVNGNWVLSSATGNATREADSVYIQINDARDDPLATSITEQFLGGASSGGIFDVCLEGSAKLITVPSNKPRIGVKGIELHQSVKNSSGGLVMQQNGVTLGEGRRNIMEWHVMLPIPNGNDTIAVYAGYSSEGIGVTSNMVTFAYEPTSYGSAIASPNWQALGVVNDVRIRVDTGVPVVAGTWYKLMIAVSADRQQAVFYVDRVRTAVINSHIPSQAVGPSLSIRRYVAPKGGGQKSAVYADYATIYAGP